MAGRHRPGSVEIMSPSRHLFAVDAAPRSGRTTVVIADEHEPMRRSLRAVLEGAKRLDVVAEAGNLAATTEQLAAHGPDVLVLDPNIARGSRLELIRDLHEQMPEMPIVLVSVDDTAGFAQRCLEAGAHGFVLADHADHELAEAVDVAADGDSYVSASVAKRLAQNGRPPTASGPERARPGSRAAGWGA